MAKGGGGLRGALEAYKASTGDRSTLRVREVNTMRTAVGGGRGVVAGPFMGRNRTELSQVIRQSIRFSKDARSRQDARIRQQLASR